MATGLTAIIGILSVTAFGPGAAANASGPEIKASFASGPGRLLAEHLVDIKASNGEAYSVHRTITDADGAVHIRYIRTYHGLRVLGGDFVVHTDARGAYAGASVGLNRPLTLGTDPKVRAAAAAMTARTHFSGDITSVDDSELIVDARSGDGRLVWDTVVRGQREGGAIPSVLHVMTDASSGSHLGAFDEIETAAGTGNSVYSGPVPVETTFAGGVYSMTDPMRGGGSTCDLRNVFDFNAVCTDFADPDNVWGDGYPTTRQSAAVDAHYAAALAYDYFRDVHGRNGVNGNGVGLRLHVHLGNAVRGAWSDPERGLFFGDGDLGVRPWVSVDIVAHEVTHSLTNSLIAGGLSMGGESGALGEATSDIFGTMVEFYAANPNDPGDFTIGEEVYPDRPLRYMFNPSLDGRSESCWSAATKDKELHEAAGVANHFFTLLAGGLSVSGICPTDKVPDVVGIGRQKAAKIWYRALDVYFTSTTSYVNTSNPGNTSLAATLGAARDLYGRCSTEYKAVLAAWKASGVQPQAGDLCLVPDIYYLTRSEAEARLVSQGWCIGTTGTRPTDDSSLHLRVVYQSLTPFTEAPTINPCMSFSTGIYKTTNEEL